MYVDDIWWCWWYWGHGISWDDMGCHGLVWSSLHVPIYTSMSQHVPACPSMSQHIQHIPAYTDISSIYQHRIAWIAFTNISSIYQYYIVLPVHHSTSQHIPAQDSIDSTRPEYCYICYICYVLHIIACIICSAMYCMYCWGVLKAPSASSGHHAFIAFPWEDGAAQYGSCCSGGWGYHGPQDTASGGLALAGACHASQGSSCASDILQREGVGGPWHCILEVFRCLEFGDVWGIFWLSSLWCLWQQLH
jgi:hypothetical protein